MDASLGKPAFRSVIFAEQMVRARGLLRRPRRRESAWPALAAATLFACSSLAFVGVVVLTPGPHSCAVASVR
jgi:hypothetical protein